MVKEAGGKSGEEKQAIAAMDDEHHP